MSSKKSNFLVQGSILAVASIVSRVIGLLYRIPLTAIIGDHGNDYYSTAFEIYSLVLLLSSYSLPMAVSKMVSRRMAFKQYTNAYRTFKGTIAFGLIAGLIGALVIYIFAVPFCNLFKTPMAVYALRVLAPTIVIVAVMAVIRGFFQGLGTMMPSAISQVVEQIINAVVSVVAAWILYNYALNHLIDGVEADEYASALGAAGGTLGTGAGALFGLLFVLFVFVLYRKRFLKMIRREQTHRKKVHVESYKSIMRILILTVVPVLLSTTIYNLVSIVDQGIFKNIATFQGYAADDISTWWGVYAGKYRVLVNVPISISSAIAASAVPTLSAAFGRKDRNSIKKSISMTLRFEMIIAIPCAVGLIVLASPIQRLLFGDATKLAAGLLIWGSISVIFYSISTMSNAMLQAIDKMRVPVINAIISLIVQAIAILIAMFVFHAGIYSVIAANIVFSLLMCILNGRAVFHASGFKPDIRKTFVLPAVAAVLMGFVTRMIYIVLYNITLSNAFSTIIAIICAIILYAVFLLKSGSLTESEILSFPKGNVILKIAKKAHLM